MASCIVTRGSLWARCWRRHCCAPVNDGLLKALNRGPSMLNWSVWLWRLWKQTFISNRFQLTSFEPVDWCRSHGITMTFGEAWELQNQSFVSAWTIRPNDESALFHVLPHLSLALPHIRGSSTSSKVFILELSRHNGRKIWAKDPSGLESSKGWSHQEGISREVQW